MAIVTLEIDVAKSAGDDAELRLPEVAGSDRQIGQYRIQAFLIDILSQRDGDIANGSLRREVVCCAQ